MSDSVDPTPGREAAGPETARLVVAALMTGAPLKARDAAEAVARASGRTFTAATVSGILARIADPSRSDLAHFIRKHKAGGAWVYGMASAALALTPGQAYDLTRRSGPGRYTLVEALREHPGLRREIDATRGETGGHTAPQPLFRLSRQEDLPERPEGCRPAVHSRPEPPAAAPPIELSVRCAGRYTLSIASSFKTFALLCIAAVLTVAAIGMLVYAFLVPAMVLAAAAAAGWAAWRRSRRGSGPS